MASATEKKTVSLVLGSGGARGMAHIGVIHWLEENNFQIESISGCSIGALIGGIYAAGKLDDFETWVTAVSKIDMVTLLDLSWNTSGLVKGDKIISTLTELVGDVAIEDLPIAYTAVAADIFSEKEVWMNTGKLFDAIRASISLPLFFTPYRIDGVDLIDGGVLNPVPIAPTFGDTTDMTIAINLGGKIETSVTPQPPVNLQLEESSALSEKIKAFLSGLTDTTDEPADNDWDAYDIANQAFDAMQSTIARQKLAAYPADYFIEFPRNACGTLEFDRSSEMIDLGYKKAADSLNHLL